jgi:hypothetical protein
MGGGGGSRRSRDSGIPSSDSGESVQPGAKTQNGSDKTESENRCYINKISKFGGTNLDVLDDVDIGDIFSIEIRNGRACVVDFEDQIVGSILESPADQLEKCIERGWEYRAEILSIDGRSCKVRITNKCLIDDRAMLASLDPEVLADISEGSVLNVVVQDDSLCAVEDSDRMVGVFAEAWTGVLIQCVETGVEYRAEVETIDGGNCTVHITNVLPDK